MGNPKGACPIGHTEERVGEDDDGGFHERMCVTSHMIDSRFSELLHHRSACRDQRHIQECTGFECEVRVVHDGIVIADL